jgi:hypothetical protein
MWVTVIGADLSWFPARHSDITFGDASQYLFDVPSWVENLLINKIEHQHLPISLSE